MYSELKYHVWLSIKAGAGGTGIYRLLDHFGDPKTVYDADSTEYYKVKGVSESLCDRLTDKDMTDTQKCLKFCEKYSVRILIYGENGYPKRLMDLPDAPFLLYAMGKDIDMDDAVAIATVGSRRCSLRGERNARAFGYELAKQGAVVVSGLAAGIDAACHAGALEAEGITVAVLGCGLDIAYPSENRELQKRIFRSGMLLTEYPPGTRPEKNNFPVRNRIISGLSQAAVVIECAEISGALITARTALKQGRMLCAVPGDPADPACAGNLSLLKNGAKLVTCAADVLEDFALSYPHVIKPDRSLKAPLPISHTRKEPCESDKVKTSKEKISPTVRVASISSELSPIGKRIAELLSETPMTADELTEKGIPLDELLTELTLMEIQGIVSAEAGGLYRLNSY